MTRIFLIGFMGTGKSTLGRALAARLPGWRFVDLDDAAEARLGITAAQAFSQGRGDDFRAAESAALADVAASADNVVVACGGGTPCLGRNMEIMLGAGMVVRLEADTSRLLRRLEEADGQRPLLAGLHGEALLAAVRRLRAAREEYYCRAHATFDATRLENADEIDATVTQFIQIFMV